MQRISEESYKMLRRLRRWGHRRQEIIRHHNGEYWFYVCRNTEQYHCIMHKSLNSAIKSVYEQAMKERGEKVLNVMFGKKEAEK